MPTWILLRALGGDQIGHQGHHAEPPAAEQGRVVQRGEDKRFGQPLEGVRPPFPGLGMNLVPIGLEQGRHGGEGPLELGQPAVQNLQLGDDREKPQIVGPFEQFGAGAGPFGEVEGLETLRREERHAAALPLVVLLQVAVGQQCLGDGRELEVRGILFEIEVFAARALIRDRDHRTLGRHRRAAWFGCASRPTIAAGRRPSTISVTGSTG